MGFPIIDGDPFAEGFVNGEWAPLPPTPGPPPYYVVYAPSPLIQTR